MTDHAHLPVQVACALLGGVLGWLLGMMTTLAAMEAFR